MVRIMNKKITNLEKSVPTGIELNDKDYMTNLLYFLKALEKNMAVALTESSNELLYKEYKKIFDDISNLQRNTYELMFKFGWYPLEEANNTNISDTLKKLDKDFQNLN